MKVEYVCMECKERFIVERSGVLDRKKSFEELMGIGKSILFPHFRHHYPDKTEHGHITFDTYPGDDFDFERAKELEKIGIDIGYPLSVCRTQWSKNVGFAF